MTVPDRLSAALVDHYRIERQLGQGGMATVYLAEDLKHKRKVAVKVLKPELAAVLGAERFVVEITTTAALQHPHILPLFDSGSADGFLYYVMPYVEGETLRSKLDRETQFGIDEAVRIAREVADALDYAHRHGVIHRDIKPENILLHDGRPMVADFGIALALSAAAGGRMTETGLSLGTPHYMSPEQATAEKEISARADIYSLGSVLYEMLTGNPPHTGASAQQIIMKIIAEPVEAVTKFRKSVPANVAAAVAKSLEKLPADRFESAAKFAEALANPLFATMSGTGAGAGLLPGRAGVSRRNFWIATSVAALSIIAAVAGWLRPAPAAVVSRFSVALPDSQSLASVAMLVGGFRLALSPDGRTIAYVGRGALPGTTRLWVRPLDQLRATPLAGTEGASNPAFSPDGKHLAFVQGNPRVLKSIAIAGGPVTTLTDSLVDQGGVSWGADGYVYYDGKLEGDGLARVRETGGAPQIASMPDSAKGETWHASPSALPNGRGVIFSIARRRATLEFDVGVLDTRTGKHTVLVRGVAGHYAASGHLIWSTSSGTLMAAPFDADRLALTGEGVPVADGVAARGLGRVDLAISTNGTLAYIAGSASGLNRELVWVTRDGAATPVDSQWSAYLLGRASLSPDGRAAVVAVVSEAGLSQVWVKRLDRGPVSKLGDNGFAPTWSPDGRMVLFTSPRSELMRGPADGSVLPAAIRTGGQFGNPTYSPDGKWIVYARSGQLYAVPTAGDTAVRALPTGPGTKSLPAISPDGRWLAYMSDETGRSEIYVRPFPNTEVAKFQVSAGSGYFPRWSRDGRELLYVDDRYNLISAPVTLAPTFAFGTPRRLFAAADFVTIRTPFEVGTDGRRFLMSRLVGGGAASRADELIVVQNFFEELKAKVKR